MSNNRTSRKGPRSVGSFLPKITGKVLAKKGFPNMALITDWAAIVGPELSAYTCPEKMTWPRQPSEPSQDEIDERERNLPANAHKPIRRINKPQRGITLKLRVESHMALDVQYALSEILERINTYFGYRAVTEIRIIQGPVNKQTKPVDTCSDHIKCQEDGPLADLTTITDDGLRKALERLDEARRK